MKLAIGEYKFGSDIFIVDHKEGRITITKNELSYEISWHDIEDMINTKFVFDKFRVRDLKNPLYFLFYKTDIASQIHKYEKDNGINENYWLSLEKTPDLLEKKENEYSLFQSCVENKAEEIWKPILL